MKKERSSNIELLRIFAILLIVAFHYSFKGGFEFETLSVNKMIINVATMFGELGVNIFVLISGYFMMKGTFRWKKVVYMMLQVHFYSWLSLLIFCKGDIAAVWKCITPWDYFPNIYGLYWYMSCYLVIYILSPYLKRLVQHLSKKEYERMLIVCLILWCVIPTIFGAQVDDTELFLNYNRFIWLTVVYLIGAYISLYGDEVRFLRYKSGTYFAGAIFMLLLVTGIIYCMECNMDVIQEIGISGATYFWRPNTIITIVWSILIFMAFLKWKVPSIKWMNRLASTTLGIYMFHDGRLAGPIWKLWLKTPQYADSGKMILHMAISVLIVFVTGAVIDLLRQMIGYYGDLVVQKIEKKIGKEA